MLPIPVMLLYHGHVSIRIVLEKMFPQRTDDDYKNADKNCKWESNSIFLTMQSAFESLLTEVL